MGGTRLYYEVVGSGPPAVFVHSGFADRRIWERQWGAFEEHRMVRYDLRGAGKSAGSSTPYFDHEDLQNLLQRLDVQRAHVVGLATGGLIALDLTVSRPELVESLALVSAAHPEVRPSAASERRRMEALAWYGKGNIDRAVEAILRAWVDGPERTPGQVDPAVRNHVKRLIREDLPRQQHQASRRPLNPPSWLRLDEVSAPTLVVGGELDAKEVRTAADLYAGGITGAEKVQMPGTGHMVNLEQAGQFNELLLRFFSTGSNADEAPEESDKTEAP